MSKTAKQTKRGFPEIFPKPPWLDQWSRMMKQIRKHLAKPRATQNDISVRAPLLADAWEECGRVRRGLEEFCDSEDKTRGLTDAILALEEIKVDIALYERLAKLSYLRAAGHHFLSSQFEIEGIQRSFGAWWSDDARTKELAEDSWELRRKTDDLALALSDRELLALTSQPRRTAARDRLRKLLGEVETISGRLRSKLDEPFAIQSKRAHLHRHEPPHRGADEA